MLDKEHPYGHHTPSDPHSAQQGYELSDIQLRITMYAGVGIVVMTFIAYIVSIFVVRYANAQPAISQFEPTPMAIEARSQPFAEGVRLQVEPATALGELEQHQMQRATTYGVVSDEPEIYRIPVDTALDLVAERGLPVFPVLATPQESSADTLEQQ